MFWLIEMNISQVCFKLYYLILIGYQCTDWHLSITFWALRDCFIKLFFFLRCWLLQRDQRHISVSPTASTPCHLPGCTSRHPTDENQGASEGKLILNIPGFSQEIFDVERHSDLDCAFWWKFIKMPYHKIFSDIVQTTSQSQYNNPFASEAVYTRNFFSDRMSDSV